MNKDGYRETLGVALRDLTEEVVQKKFTKISITRNTYGYKEGFGVALSKKNLHAQFTQDICHVCLSYNLYFSACLFSLNNIFLSQQISEQYFLTCFFNETNGATDRGNFKRLYKFQSLYLYLESHSINILFVYLSCV